MIEEQAMDTVSTVTEDDRRSIEMNEGLVTPMAPAPEPQQQSISNTIETPVPPSLPGVKNLSGTEKPDLPAAETAAADAIEPPSATPLAITIPPAQNQQPATLISTDSSPSSNPEPSIKPADRPPSLTAPVQPLTTTHTQGAQLRQHSGTIPQVVFPKGSNSRRPTQVTRHRRRTVVRADNSSVSGSTTAHDDLSQPPTDAEMQIVTFADRRSRVIKHVIKTYFMVIVIIVISVVAFVMQSANVILRYALNVSNTVGLIMNLVSVFILLPILTTIVLSLALALRKVTDVFNQSRELFAMLGTLLASLISQLVLLSPWWPLTLNTVMSIVTGHVLLFASGVYPVSLMLRFRKQTTDALVASVDQFDDFLHNKICCQAFADFVKADFCAENLLFYLDVRQYKQLIEERRRHDAIKLLQLIISKYFSRKTGYELNVPSAFRADVLSKYQEFMTSTHTNRAMPPSDIFSRIESSCLDGLLHDSWPRFLSSPKFAELNDKLDQMRDQVMLMA